MLRKKLKTKKTKKTKKKTLVEFIDYVYRFMLINCIIYSQKQKLYYHDFAIPFFL